MEELQDAIEDAQYVNAISAHGNPIPTSKWDKPTEVGLEEWKNTKASQINKGDTPAFTPEWFMSQPIGFFLFAQFVKAYFDDYEQLNFMEDVIRFKKSAEKQRMEIATSIINNYLFPIKEGDKRVRNEIEHYDVARTNSIFSKEETKRMVCGSLDEFSRSSRIGVQGRLIKETRNIEKRNGNIPDIGIFDKIEAIVFYALISKYWHEYLISEEYDRCINFLWFQDREVVESDFYRIRVLGRGGFGLVSCVRKKASGKLYAMKVMNKKRIKMTKSEQLTLNECLVLRSINSPFVVNLKYSFQSNHDIFLILDLMTGGDLSFHLTQQGFFSKEMCIYYAARIILGIQALHDKEFVYRDLKPENCLLAEDGRMKLTDLGLSCKITPKLCGAAGTRGYWAPEMLRRDENGKRIIYGHAVDWFSFGCLLAELITGKNPFRTEAAVSFGKTKGSKKTSDKAIDYAILEMEPPLDSSNFDPNSRDLCRKLLEKNESNRLGANGCEEIMAHPWFKGTNWEAIISDKMSPPFIPYKDVNALSQRDIGQFNEGKAYQETSWNEDDELNYRNWNWTNSVAYATEVLEFLIYERETGTPLLPVEQSDCCCVVS